MRLTLVSAGLCLVLVSCAWFGAEAHVGVTVPEPPEHWASAFADLGFIVVFTDCEARLQSVTLANPIRCAEIACSKAGNSAVLAYPVTARDTGLLRPAGGLYPLDVVEGAGHSRLALSWERGPVALLMRRLSDRGFDTSLVNAGRLVSYISAHPDPWALDLDGIAEKLIAGCFSVYDIDLLPARDVSLAPGAGEWFLESPCAPAVKTADAENLLLPRLSFGMHALFSVQGGRILISVLEKETVVGRREKSLAPSRAW